MRRSLAVITLLAALFAAGLAAQPAGAAVAAPGTASAAAYGGSAAGNAALNWAERSAAGCWYVYGGAGPCGSGYDCSGLVMAAFAHGAGIALPHSTYAMLGSPRLHRIPLSSARRGDLLFYGSGHVEIDTVLVSHVVRRARYGHDGGLDSLERVLRSDDGLQSVVVRC